MFQSERSGSFGTRTNETQQYSKLLLEEKARVEVELRGRMESLRIGRASNEDQGPILHEQFVSIRHNNFAYEKIRAIDAALKRVRDGEYGVCEECSEPISEKRLKAVPWTRCCLHCQENLANDNGAPVFRHLRAA